MYILGLIPMGPSVLELSHACHLRHDLVFQGDLPAPFRACSCGATISETTQSDPQHIPPSFFFYFPSLLRFLAFPLPSIFKKDILLIMLLQLVHFPPFTPSCTPPPSHIPPYSSSPWAIQISSLASTFPILFLTSPCLLCAYLLCFLFPARTFFPHSPLPH